MADGDFPNRYGARLIVTTRSNERLSAEVEDVRGTVGRPIAADEVLSKFFDCARRALEDGAPSRSWRLSKSWTVHLTSRH